MSNFNVSNLKGETVGSVDIPDSLTKASHSPQVLQDAIVAYRANQRSGNHSTLTKGEVAGSGKKPWRQKGTGRARAGYKQSPLWRGGGVVFGPKPRDYSKHTNQKAGHAALRLALGQKINEGAVTILDMFEVGEAKTKSFAAMLKSIKLDRGIVVVEKISRELGLASRNVSGVEVCEARNLNSYQILCHPRLVVTKAGLAELKKRVAVESEAAS